MAVFFGTADVEYIAPTSISVMVSGTTASLSVIWVVSAVLSYDADCTWDTMLLLLLLLNLTERSKLKSGVLSPATLNIVSLTFVPVYESIIHWRNAFDASCAA